MFKNSLSECSENFHVELSFNYSTNSSVHLLGKEMYAIVRKIFSFLVIENGLHTTNLLSYPIADSCLYV